MIIEILICTIDGGIADVAKMLMPQRADVRYLVSWQQTAAEPKNVPELLLRDDVRVLVLEGKGLSRNRNNALKHAQGDVCLIADDDLVYFPESIEKVVETFNADTTLDFATFRYVANNNQKSYPAEGFEFALGKYPKGYYVTSFEIAFRRMSVQGKLWFDEHFGLGAPELQAGEEEVFVHDALAMGLRGRFVPFDIVRHDDDTTAVRMAKNKGVIMASAAYLQVAYKRNYKWLRALLMAWRVSRKTGLNLFKTMKWVWHGVKYAKSIGR
jgi:glycosyltransferase involved in cell wall biosynthesis